MGLISSLFCLILTLVSSLSSFPQYCSFLKCDTPAVWGVNQSPWGMESWGEETWVCAVIGAHSQISPWLDP